MRNQRCLHHYSYLEQCFGGFPISVSMDEDGNMEEVCGCSGDECSNYYFLINLAIFVAL